MTLRPFDLLRLREAYRGGDSPVEIAQESLRRIAAYGDPAVWISRVSEPEVLRRAEALETRRSEMEQLPLYGIPFAVKDNIDVAGLPTTAGCPEFSYAPERDASVVERLLAAGAILLGKTNLDQFATGLVGTRSPHGAPRCVFDHKFISGGSSSGSAVTVAAGLVTFALGTDTAGSGRVPAAFNNIVGLKPTRGLISATGTVPACRSLDCVSIFAQTMGDAAEILRVVQGFDGSDPYSRIGQQRSLPTSRFKFGVPRNEDRDFFGNRDYERLYEDAIARLSKLGGEAIDIDYAPFLETAALLYDGPWVAERYVAIKNFFDEYENTVEPTVRAIIAGAKRWSAADAFAGEYRRRALRRAADAEMAKVDVLLLPTAPTHYTVAEIAREPIELNKRLGLYTNFVNLLDYCALAVPAGFCANGLPFAVTLIAPAFSDFALARIADRLHRDANTGIGAARDAALPQETREPREAPLGIEIFVVGAHLSGMPLNHELKNLGAEFVRAARTAPCYRLVVVPNTTPAKPGLLRLTECTERGIAGEIWRLGIAEFGRFAAAIPSPLGLGKIALEGGGEVSGFLCEAFASEGARDITSYGGWRAYVESSR